MNVLVFDTETSGLPQWKAGAGAPGQPHIVQLGAILYEATTLDRKVRHELNLTLRCPIMIEAAAAAVHGIDNKTNSRYGVSPILALELFGELTRQADVIVAHNLKFDSLLYEAAALRYALDWHSYLKPTHFCTMLKCTNIVKLPGRNGTYKWPKLFEAYEYFWPGAFNYNAAHDAMYDVKCCADLYFKLMETPGEHNSSEGTERAVDPTASSSTPGP